MKTKIITALAACLLTATAHAATVTDRGIMCKPDVTGKSTCMTDVTILDDLSLALLSGASDDEAAAMVSHIRSQDARVQKNVRGFGELTHYVSILAIGSPAGGPKGPSFDSLPVSDMVTQRRADITAHVTAKKPFLLPVSQLIEPAISRGDGRNPATSFISFDTTGDSERLSIGATTSNVCAKKRLGEGFYCITLTNVSSAKQYEANTPNRVRDYFHDIPMAMLPGFVTSFVNVPVANQSVFSDGVRVLKLQGAEKLLYGVVINVTGPTKAEAGSSMTPAVATKAMIFGPRGAVVGHPLITD